MPLQMHFFLNNQWLLLILFFSFRRLLFEYFKFNSISYNIFTISIVPLLNPNTPYSDKSKASYVEQAMTGLLLGDGVLVKKKYKNGKYIFKIHSM